MPYITEHKQKFTELKFFLDNQDQLRKQANGGNSILFSYPPAEEQLYLEKAKELYRDEAAFIDISKLLVEFIDEDGWKDFKDYYQDFKETPAKVFRSPDDPAIDLFDLIIREIESACKEDKKPFLIRTGCLDGTGIDNLNIMEHKSVMSQSEPLVVFYPSRLDGDNLYFLNYKSASKYRCTLVK